jgi:hypothetical protein
MFNSNFGYHVEQGQRRANERALSDRIKKTNDNTQEYIKSNKELDFLGKCIISSAATSARTRNKLSNLQIDNSETIANFRSKTIELLDSKNRVLQVDKDTSMKDYALKQNKPDLNKSLSRIAENITASEFIDLIENNRLISFRKFLLFRVQMVESLIFGYGSNDAKVNKALYKEMITPLFTEMSNPFPDLNCMFKPLLSGFPLDMDGKEQPDKGYSKLLHRYNIQETYDLLFTRLPNFEVYKSKTFALYWHTYGDFLVSASFERLSMEHQEKYGPTLQDAGQAGKTIDLGRLTKTMARIRKNNGEFHKKLEEAINQYGSFPFFNQYEDEFVQPVREELNLGL